ncbi:MAG: alpha/beta hydrolase [Actinomycetota bacterium]|nr:alpha/beta hydrolase [Actinomycetota bacterium]
MSRSSVFLAVPWRGDRRRVRRGCAVFVALGLTGPLHPTVAGAGPVAGAQLPEQARVLAVDHAIPHVSTVPANAGEAVQLQLRERVRPGVEGRANAHPDAAVLFVPGSATPSVPAYDLSFEDYSWMAYLARAGLDVFALDPTGYGNSPRPKMDDPCNVNPPQQVVLVPNPLPGPCALDYPFRLGTTSSEQDELDAAVDYIRALRGVDRVSLVGWSLGGHRAGIYAAQHPEKVDRLVLLAPNYVRTSPSNPPARLPQPGFPMALRTRAEQVNWPGVGCAGQVDDAVKDPLWATVNAYDPLGATWGPPGGVMRIPVTSQWGWNATTAGQVVAPTLIIRGALDTTISATNLTDLHDDLGTTDKALITVPCASHFVVWESQRHVVHALSGAWLTGGALPHV